MTLLIPKYCNYQQSNPFIMIIIGYPYAFSYIFKNLIEIQPEIQPEIILDDWIIISKNE